MRFASAIVVAAALAVACARPAHAGCNLIPGTAKSFQSTLGATNRPFAAPGEPVELRLRPCDPTALGMNATDHVVTVVFTPESGPRHAVVLTAAADCSALGAQLAACQAQLTGGGTATCVAGAAAGMAIVDRNGVPHLGFTFPNTDLQYAPDADRRTLSGPAAIAVTAPSDPLPCGLATAPCAGQSGLIACIDDYFANDGACGTAVPLGTFPHFTALPPPNDYRTACYADDPPCDIDLTGELRFAADTAGNLFFPVQWQGVLVPSGVPVPRLLRTRVKSPLPFRVPDQVFVNSFTPEAGKLPPTVLIKPGKMAKAVCKGAGIGFSLDEPAGQGSLVARLQTGTGAEALFHCLEFSGPAVIKDTPAVGGGSGVFKAKNAPAPAACPIW